ncbi:MAG: efflux RND transporter periplasmic adaptor subunit [Sporocytophaga sp.]|uniref:efflux RND transporter periplasmic adaptor subunit n=1 Tax=Sporocytophaga sp. TaxID=2231183 RepID=UPI001B1F8FA9|nr:efflux RND transporter periplasmic adaptor subunit [Sporocytophaga sp.]MBO9701767.1 efflux RND transporter periplasmic adaptor subunit [Sporocytophaga sp.]
MRKYISILFIVTYLLSCESKTKHTDHSDNDSLYYTCSMDPQVMEKKPGKCPICKMELTPVKISNSIGIKLSEQQEKLANIKTLRVGYDYIDSKIYATGVVKENENNIIFINARMDGRIDKLNFKTKGAFIRKGDIIYKIYSEMLASTQSELINANKKLQGNPNDVSMRAIMDAAIKKLELWGVSKIQIEKIKIQKKPSIPFPIESPSTGYINNVNITEGAIVMEGNPLIELTNYKTLWVDAEFYSTEIIKIRKGSLVDVKIEGTQDSMIKGKVIEVLPQVSSGSAVTIVRILVVPDSLNARPGMQANIYWHHSNEKTLMVPSNAVLRDSKGTIVWVKKGGIYESKIVHIGEISGDRASIHHGLNEGDTVVISGSYLLQSENILKKGGSHMEGHNMSTM